jgi:HEAT repeat protein
MAQEKRMVSVLVNLMPESDTPHQTSTFTGPPPDIAAPIFAEVLEGGRENILALSALVGDQSDYKAGYLLHGVALYVGQPGQEIARRLFADALASQIGNDQLPAEQRRFLMRELQVAGGPEAVEAIGSRLLNEELGESAAQALIAIKTGAAEQFRKALPQAKGKSRVTIIQALGVVGDAESVAALKEAVRDEDQAVRIAAAWALANIGAPEAVEAVRNASNAQPGWERIQTTKACLLLAEKLVAAGKKSEAAALWTHLRDTRTDAAEKYVRDAAEKALAAAGGT